MLSVMRPLSTAARRRVKGRRRGRRHDDRLPRPARQQEGAGGALQVGRRRSPRNRRAGLPIRRATRGSVWMPARLPSHQALPLRWRWRPSTRGRRARCSSSASTGRSRRSAAIASASRRKPASASGRASIRAGEHAVAGDRLRDALCAGLRAVGRALLLADLLDQAQLEHRRRAGSAPAPGGYRRRSPAVGQAM